MGSGPVESIRRCPVWLPEDVVLDTRPRGSRAGKWLVHVHTSQRLVVLEVAWFQMVLARVPGGWQGSDPEGIWVALWSLDLILQLTGGEGVSVPWASLLLCCHLEELQSLAGPRLAEVWAAVWRWQPPRPCSPGGQWYCLLREGAPSGSVGRSAHEQRVVLVKLWWTVEGVGLLPGALRTCEGVSWSRPVSFHLSF